MRPASLTDALRTAVLATGRPVAAALRRALTPPTIPSKLEFVTLHQGPLAGCHMQLPVPSELADAICHQRYERASLQLLEHMIDPNDVCYDIGGHYGVFTLAMARLASRGQVHTFEPIAKLADCITQSLVHSQIKNTHVHRVAMAGQAGTITMRTASDATGDDSMAFIESYGGVQTPRSQVQYGQFTELVTQSVTLDRCDAPPPQFIKLDVEGAEVAVLQGGLQTLQQHKPRMLVEIHGVERGLAIAQLLGELGYSAWQIAPPAMAPQVLWLHLGDAQALAKLQAITSPIPLHLFGPNVQPPQSATSASAPHSGSS